MRKLARPEAHATAGLGALVTLHGSSPVAISHPLFRVPLVRGRRCPPGPDGLPPSAGLPASAALSPLCGLGFRIRGRGFEGRVSGKHRSVSARPGLRAHLFLRDERELLDQNVLQEIDPETLVRGLLQHLRREPRGRSDRDGRCRSGRRQ